MRCESPGCRDGNCIPLPVASPRAGDAIRKPQVPLTPEQKDTMRRALDEEENLVLMPGVIIEEAVSKYADATAGVGEDAITALYAEGWSVVRLNPPNDRGDERLYDDEGKRLWVIEEEA